MPEVLPFPELKACVSFALAWFLRWLPPSFAPGCVSFRKLAQLRVMGAEQDLDDQSCWRCPVVPGDRSLLFLSDL